jgi:hypothetical protein
MRRLIGAPVRDLKRLDRFQTVPAGETRRATTRPVADLRFAGRHRRVAVPAVTDRTRTAVRLAGLAPDVLRRPGDSLTLRCNNTERV